MMIVIAVQLIAGHVLGFGGAMAIGAGHGWELLILVIGDTVGVWGVGALADWLRGKWDVAALTMRFGATAACATLGVGLVAITPATGVGQVAYPLIGAVAGYYVAPSVARTRRLHTRP
jgi:hypothetical protein